MKNWYKPVKRAADLAGALLLMGILSPLFLLIMLAIAVDSEGGVLFAQSRMGKDGRPFIIFKFRTMYPQAPADTPTSALDDPSRHITPVGRFLRRTSLDELPQLFNILKGDMSFVGPRPVVLTETDLLDLRTKNRSCLVRPGLTGWAQVNGRDNVTVAEKARLDAEYVQMLSFRTDVRVLVKTVSCVLESKDVREGANPAITAEEKSA